MSQTRATEDDDVDLHPVCSWLLKIGFDLAIRAIYRREFVFPVNFRVFPGTMIACNHQRDSDGPMLGMALVHRRGLRFHGSVPFFATREDLFRPGILARLTVHWPRPLSVLLRYVSLAWFFPLGRTEPIRRAREFTLGDALRALAKAGLGDADAGSLLNARGRRETAVEPRQLSVDALLKRSDDALEARWGLRRLGRKARAAIAPDFRATVERQLAHFARRLDHGCSIFFAPEGTISRNGHFGRVRAGFYRVASMAKSPPWIQPIALAYDRLAPGRSRVVIRVGEAFHADTGASRRTFNVNLRQTVLSLATVTPSHLLAHFLLHGPSTFMADDLARWLDGARAALVRNGAPLDPLFERVAADRLATRRLRWLRHKRLLAREGRAFRNTCPSDAPPGWRHPANVVRYLDNALNDSVPDIERLAPC
ncbi:MAG: lysophospholipid acyltransferase family protein [Rhodanobacteraceae bacterium]